MAERNYLVEGLSGAGKSSVYEELIRRGYPAVSTDRAWSYHADPDTGLRGGPRHFDNFVWDEQRALGELECAEPDVLFVCGSSRNRDRFLPQFTKVFNLRIDDETMVQRLRERTNNDFGKQPEQVERMLALNRSDVKPLGAIDLDATKPLEEVVDELLRLADCERARSNSMVPPWSKRGSTTGRSFVIPTSALATVPADADPPEHETISRIDYSWSGEVLATLLSYLDEQGIDLTHSDHGAVAAALSQAGARSVFILTSPQRERYLPRLDPTEFDGSVLRRYYEALHETAAAGVGYALLDGIAFLRDTLEPLEPALVAVLVIE